MRILLPLLAGLALALAAPAAADITTGLEGYWPFSGDAQDASGNANHGTPSAAAQLTDDRFGNPASAYHFDGLSARIDIPSSASLAAPTTAITMAAWIRRDGWGMVGSQYSPILTKSTSSATTFQYRFITTPAGIGTAFNDWNTSHSVPIVPVEDAWYHLVSTWESDTIRVYVNGTMVDEAEFVTTIVPDAHNLSLGSDTPGVLEIFYGDLDEIRIYSRALSAADVSELAGPVTAAPLPVAVGSAPELGRAFPNPARHATAIPFALPAAATVEAEVLDVTGRRVRSLLTGRRFAAGSHSVGWDGRDAAGRPVAGGVYLVRLVTPEGSAARKVLIRR